MSKKHRNPRVALPADMEDITNSLKKRAVEMCKTLNHTLGAWQPAKKKWGKGAVQAYCPSCFCQIIVVPRGSLRIGSTSLQHALPAITGDAPFEECDPVRR